MCLSLERPPLICHADSPQLRGFFRALYRAVLAAGQSSVASGCFFTLVVSLNHFVNVSGATPDESAFLALSQ
jgi:hypothetical protein